MTINLIPPELKQAKKGRALLAKMIRAALVVLFVAICASAALVFANRSLDKKVTETRQSIDEKNKESAHYKDIETNILNTNSKLTKIASIDQNRATSSTILGEISRCTPTQVSINSLVLSLAAKTVTLSGNAETRKEVALFKDKLESSDYFKNVYFSSSSLDTSENNFTYSLTAELEKIK